MKKMLMLAMATASALMCVSGAVAQDSGALVDALVKKGVLSSQEAEEIRADLMKDAATTSAGKLNLSSQIKKLTLSGDVRLRYQYDGETLNNVTAAGIPNNNTTAAGATGRQERNRYRVRVRLNGDAVLADNLSVGLSLETNQSSADSSNMDLTNGWAKENVGLGRIVIEYKPEDYLKLSAGKMYNPFYTTDLTWDPDIRPAGGAENFSLDKAFDLGGDLHMNLVAGQFVYLNNTDNAFGYEGAGVAASATGNNADATGHTTPWLFEQQLVTKYDFDKDTVLTLAPGYMAWLGGSTAGLAWNTNTTGTSAASIQALNQATFADIRGTSDLQILQLPGDISWKAWDQAFKFYWDVDYNVDGGSRVQNVYENIASSGGGSYVATSGGSKLGGPDSLAYLVGFDVGQLKKKGDWQADFNYRYIGLGSVDPNLMDSDFALKQLNQQGIKTSLAYNFTDFFSGTVTYYNSWAIHPGTVFANGGGNTFAAAGQYNTQMVQADLSIKF